MVVCHQSPHRVLTIPQSTIIFRNHFSILFARLFGTDPMEPLVRDVEAREVFVHAPRDGQNLGVLSRVL